MELFCFKMFMYQLAS